MKTVKRSGMTKIVDWDVMHQHKLNNVICWSWLFSSTQQESCIYGKISNTFLIPFSNKTLVIKAEFHKILIIIANRDDPDQTCPICLGLFGRQLLFKILEHLPHSTY